LRQIGKNSSALKRRNISDKEIDGVFSSPNEVVMGVVVVNGDCG